MALQKDDIVTLIEQVGIPRDMIVRELWTNAKPYWELEAQSTGELYIVSVPLIMRKVV